MDNESARRTADLLSWETEKQDRINQEHADMLAALKKCSNFFTNHEDTFGIEPEHPDELDCARIAREVIARVEGA